MKTITIYTDGAYNKYLNVGGWGVLLQYKSSSKELFGGEFNTTNNRMELIAAIEALSALNQPCLVNLYTDSKYLQLGMTTHIRKWRLNNWKYAIDKGVKNLDLWVKLDDISRKSEHVINWKWIRAHSNNEGNERADALARKGVYTTRGL